MYKINQHLKHEPDGSVKLPKEFLYCTGKTENEFFAWRDGNDIVVESTISDGNLLKVKIEEWEKKNHESRFMVRKAYLINFHCLTEVMQELLDDRTLEIERDYPVLSFYSSGHDCYYDEEEIRERIGDHLGVTIVASVMFADSEVVYFIEDK